MSDAIVIVTDAPALAVQVVEETIAVDLADQLVTGGGTGSGVPGPPGADGADGEDGADGASAYEIWLAAGNSGSEAEFLASLVGPVGPTGAIGPQGPQGETGPAGPAGPTGPAGADGTPGADGADGADGLSAYEVWLAAGNSGSEDDFFAAIVDAAATPSALWDAWHDTHLYGNNVAPFTSAAIGGGALALPALELAHPDQHPGVVRLRSSASAGSGYRITTTAGHLSLSRSGCVQAILAVSGLATGTVRVGFLDTTDAGDVTDGWYFEIAGLSLTGKTANGGTRSQTGTAYTLTADAMVRLEARADEDYTTITFAVYDMDGAALWSATLATNLPPSTLAHWSGAGVVATSSAAAEADLCHVDYLGAGTWQGWLDSRRAALIGPQGPQGETGAPGPTDHGALTGLDDDDHGQYLNQSRGDARYSQLGHAHAIADLPAASSNPVALGAASPGSATTLSRGDHVHPTTGLMLTTHPANSIVGFSNTGPLMNGTISQGNSARVSRQDHVHPTDTSRAAASHAHAASDITSGTLDAARLPAATTSARGGVVLGTDTMAIITASLTLYVATTGSDTTGDGTSGNPWATPHRAFLWLSRRRIDPGVTVTLSIGAGDFTGLATLDVSHPDLSRINIVGAGCPYVASPESGTRLTFASGDAAVDLNCAGMLKISLLEIAGPSTVANGLRINVPGGTVYSLAGLVITGFQYGVRMLGGQMRCRRLTVRDFTLYGIVADMQSYCQLQVLGGETILIDADSDSSDTVSGTVGIYASNGAIVRRIGTVTIDSCATVTGADATGTII